MIFTKTKLDGAYIVELEHRRDSRGFFARAWCQHEFSDQGLVAQLVQVNISFSIEKGTLRVMHYQTAPFEETKLMRLTKGGIYDVIIDLCPASPTYKQWIGTELTADNYKMLYAPEWFAHGFQTVEDHTEVVYHVSQFYAPQSDRGVHYDDPAFGIVWPADVRVISD